tara:strand:+ start:191 stop:424 length:234 start_codon:yes stop_codon:yes gene_type:complete
LAFTFILPLVSLFSFCFTDVDNLKELADSQPFFNDDRIWHLAAQRCWTRVSKIQNHKGIRPTDTVSDNITLVPEGQL